MKKITRFITFFVFSLFSIKAFSQTILNPVEGSWANKQVLLVDYPESYSVYYSLSGEDPETSGIAYDGPALLDVDGDVSLLVAFIDEKGEKKLESVKYKVESVSLPENEEDYKFLDMISSTGYVDYSAGDTFTIPSRLEYSFGKNNYDFEAGTQLSMDKKSVLFRALPCTLTDGKAFWRFLILVHPVSSGIYTRKDMPFEISDWTKFSFKDRKKIYKIDDSWWYLPKDVVKLDRSVNHMISWQDIDYKEENIIQYFILPPKPELKTEVLENGQVNIFTQGDEAYKFAVLDKDGNYSELFDQITIDTFKGDNFAGKLEAGLFYDSVFQGKIAINFDVHKKMPLMPEISSSVPGNFIRQNTKITIKSPENNKVFVSIAGPVILEDDYSSDVQDTLFELSAPDFIPLKKTTFNLTSNADGAAAYKILAYCVDSNGVQSKISEYSVIIDTCNYYLDSSNLTEEKIAKANGSKEYPFTSFSDLMPLLKNSRYVRVKLSGDIYAPNEKIILDSNCRLEGTSQTRLIVGPNTKFEVRSSSLSVNDLLITLDEHNNAESSSLFHVQRGVLYLNNSEISCLYGKNGTVINSDNSVINIENSGITSTADVYSCSLASVQSKIFVKKSRISSVASTAVNFSCQGGLFELRESDCKVTASMGRIAELFDTYSTISKNVFSGNLRNPSGNNKAVYFDKKNHSVEYNQNSESGF